MGKQQLHHSRSRKFAELLDNRFTIPGTNIRYGIDPLIGLFSGIGDLAGAVFSVYFMFYAVRLGAETSVLLRMFVNILADLTIGAIPVLGDIFDAGWKANLRNARLLEKLEENPEKLKTQSKWLMWLLFSILVLILTGVIFAIGWLTVVVWNTLFN